MAKRVFRTKKKLSGVRAMYRAWSEWEVGDYIIGTYKGSKTDNYDKPNWLIEVEEASFVSDAKLARKLQEDNLVIGLNSNGMLDAAMENVSEGDMIQVMYNGKSEIEKGKYAGKEAHVVQVDLVEEDGAEEAPAPMTKKKKQAVEDEADYDV